ncbi:hypothetical protein TREPR_3646 [Treponema primitia ZAS-2]|uniref:Lipoprotein n=1 Tax=Treponema primitia (strain ATCC BAA-887 / DSM 12427 / ZAS-2) TaxID=545694 RepID=F5YQY1_TREPZ|nr:CsgG/HfaB family protein [Treponema primitia]AEF86860.1 hypothetical protein TREPR_3646 [Treponema primitia ZAS-2]
MPYIFYCGILMIIMSCTNSPTVLQEQPTTKLEEQQPIIKEPEINEKLNVDKLDNTVQLSYQNISNIINTNSRVGVINIVSTDPAEADFISQGLIAMLVLDRNKNGKKYSVVDRDNIELLKKEQELQMSGDVSDETMISIGKWLGLTEIITGSLIKIANRWCLNIRVLNVENGEIEGVSIEYF